ncbi:drug/metabolite transporter (DMT)-like permease [Microbacteriaceae bacterium SG_E_30_P1]|uniref:Drug/metabolite transporter (DMT)-like permease n=1 Tax=Antiquaquibacter oligotrophicus TaxID=2880260 RepID=A0ABT6KRE3_9MICO|nr:EamA family transporter [Antiquaquibacter oligotrophicus]MDH6182551.1 drug/metabolite transporter (DMT)-like permease [Antiquaquibacter oligotrophicus]UDF14482.1 EamA family transporter [Antiquaquibacter oligotrophicus]
MITVLVGLGSALVYGAADFFGGLAARRMSTIFATAVAALAGLGAAAVIGLPLVGGAWSTEAVLLGMLSGVLGAIALALLYACLAIGPMSILSPLTAVVSAIVPLTVGLVGGDRLGLLGYIALSLALVAVVLVGFTPSGNGELVRGAVRPSLRGVLMAIGSGAAIGAFLVVIDQTPDDSGIVPLVLNRATSSTILFAAVAILVLTASRRGTGRVLNATRAGVLLAVTCGVLDALANAGLLLGVRLGELSVIAVLTALYPAGTIILAAVVLKERIAVLQYVGLALAILAGAMLALG